jgi:hypothetical protein
MSNTADVTPYVDAGSSVARVGTAARAASGLFSRSAADRAADEQLAERRRAARLSCAAVTLVGNDLAPLVQAATELGYAPVKAVQTRASARLAQSPVRRLDRGVHLVNAQGERLSMVVDGPSIKLEGSGLQAVVRQRTLTAVSRHLQQISGGRATTRRAADGSLHLTASELPGRYGDGAAKVAVVVDAAGNVKVDIDNVRGRRCESLLGDIAKAVGGQVRSKKLKPSYYEVEPGEPARPRTRI